PIRCYQSGNTLNGQPIDIDADRQQLWNDLTGTFLMKAYKVTLPDGKTIYNTPNLLGGNDGWDPLGHLPEIRRAEALTGERLTGLPVAMKIKADRKDLAPQDDHLTLTASERLWGDYDCNPTSSSIRWSAPSTLSITGATGANAHAVSANTYPQSVECVIDAATESGLKGATCVRIAPFLLDAPAITQTPAIEHEKQSLKLNYALTESDEADNSYIVWYRSTRPDLSDSTAVRHGRGLTAQTYPLTPADKGHYISATIFPRRANTRQGEGVNASYDRPVSGGMIGLLPRKESSLSTSWAEIPVRRSAPGRKGFWQFDSYKPADTAGHDWVADEQLSWYYGHGEDAASEGLGLVQATKGARLSYIPMRDGCRKMTLSLVAEPCKGPGQGFGSATSQYMDICVKFDPVTLTGYGLRIERTPEFDKAVTFTLVRYADGKVTPISDPQPTSCFRNPCTIKVDITDSNIVATASTGAPDVTVSNPAIKPHVLLTAPVDKTSDTGLMIQHTGSVGASATLLRDLNVRWD
ncbi:MAG: hypothetical protein K2K92_08455, partial [Duncaniella sp.]|nr:hypothetical protein [Duncaniella sp.]